MPACDDSKAISAPAALKQLGKTPAMAITRFIFSLPENLLPG